MQKTAMIELRDKLLEEVGNLKDASQSSEHINGYREALKNISNDIDAQMLCHEKEQISSAFESGMVLNNSSNRYVSDIEAENYYLQNFGEVV